MDKEKCNNLIEYTKKGNIFHCNGCCSKCLIKDYLIRNKQEALDREQAKEGVALVLGASEERIKNYIKYFEEQGIEFVGDNIPYYITYVPELDTVREAIDEEMLERNQRELKENEILINGKIVDYDINTQKIVNNEIIDKTREDYIDEKVITLDTEKLKARNKEKKN